MYISWGEELLELYLWDCGVGVLYWGPVFGVEKFRQK